MTQLQKQLSREYKSSKNKKINYPKYVVVVNPKKITELGWKNRQKLETEIKGNRLILRPKKK